MKRRLVIALGLAGLCGLAVLLVLRLAATSPTYHHHPIIFWVRELTASDPHRSHEAAAAFQTLGSNSVPGLAKLLRRQDSALRQKTSAWAGKLPARLANMVRRPVGPLDATQVRIGAARALALLGPQAQAALPALEQALRDDSPRVRWDAAQALGYIGAPGVPVLAAFLTAPDPQVRYCAACALGCVSPDAASLAAPSLFKAMADTNQTVSFHAGASLSKLGTNLAPFLTNVMANPDPLWRQRAARVLGTLRYHSLVVPPLVEMLHDPEPACRTTAVQTLAGLGLPDRAMTQAYLAALKDPEAQVRLGAVQGLAQARTQRALLVPALTSCLSDESPAVREAAAHALGHFGTQAQPASTNLTQLLQDKEESVRAAAREALEQLNPAAAGHP